MVFDRITKRREQAIIKTGMNMIQEGYKAAKVQAELRRFYDFNLAKDVLLALKNYV